MPFRSLGITEDLLHVIEKLQYSRPYPIQEVAIPAILNKKDVLGIAKTGSGKTASYAIPIIQLLQHEPAPQNRYIQSLVMVPTRELAVQVQEVFQVFIKESGSKLKSMAVYGGVSINPQMIALQGVNILIATPGRLLDLINSKAVHIGETKTMVLDEADKMLNLGFQEEIDRILNLLPVNRQNLLFSATLNPEIEQLNRFIFRDPTIIKIEEQLESKDLASISQTGYFVEEEKKGPLLRYIIKNNDFKQILIFASSVFVVDKIVFKLRQNNLDAMAIHSKKSQGARLEAMNKFKSGKLRILVATDLIARGIDIELLPCVINYELPRSPKDYIHRIGRTGRADAKGVAISFVTPEEEHHFKIIQKKMGKMVDMIDSKNLDLI
jgi:ATP-dependent RNA helicase RhlE